METLAPRRWLTARREDPLVPRPRDIDTVCCSHDRLVRLLEESCPERRIDLAGLVALPRALPHAQRWHDWLAAGHHGGLEYLTRNPAERIDPTLRNPWARSVLVFAQRYTDGWPRDCREPVAGGAEPRDDPAGTVPWTDRVSRYARGQDYHDVLLAGVKGVVDHLRSGLPGLVAHASTDTGPYLERETAWYAGLGFLGKNTCLIHEKLGSGLFLGVALTNLEVEGIADVGPAVTPLYGTVDRRLHPPLLAPTSLCGSCTRCLDACPTGALLEEGGLDANRCISTWSIEWRGRTPVADRSARAGLLFGCDICQAVCPWNQRAARHLAGSDVESPPEEYSVLDEHEDLRLSNLLDLSDDEFRIRFRRTPLWRCHPEGLRRNAGTVAENLACSDLGRVDVDSPDGGDP